MTLRTLDGGRLFACFGRLFVGQLNLSGSVVEVADFSFKVFRKAGISFAVEKVGCCLGTGSFPEEKSLLCRSATTDLRSFSACGTGPDALMPNVGFGFTGSEGGGMDKGGDGFGSIVVGKSLTKFSGNNPRLPLSSPSNQPSSSHFLFNTVIIVPSGRESSSG